jgi:hypothetical protein
MSRSCTRDFLNTVTLDAPKLITAYYDNYTLSKKWAERVWNEIFFSYNAGTDFWDVKISLELGYIC